MAPRQSHLPNNPNHPDVARAKAALANRDKNALVYNHIPSHESAVAETRTRGQTPRVRCGTHKNEDGTSSPAYMFPRKSGNTVGTPKSIQFERKDPKPTTGKPSYNFKPEDVDFFPLLRPQPWYQTKDTPYSCVGGTSKMGQEAWRAFLYEVCYLIVPDGTRPTASSKPEEAENGTSATVLQLNGDENGEATIQQFASRYPDMPADDKDLFNGWDEGQFDLDPKEDLNYERLKMAWSGGIDRVGRDPPEREIFEQAWKSKRTGGLRRVTLAPVWVSWNGRQGSGKGSVTVLQHMVSPKDGMSSWRSGQGPEPKLSDAVAIRDGQRIAYERVHPRANDAIAARNGHSTAYDRSHDRANQRLHNLVGRSSMGWKNPQGLIECWEAMEEDEKHRSMREIIQRWGQETGKW